MDFNLILLILGLGLLGIVILFALWGFLGGLKRELSCIAVFIILLVLAWLVFGNSGVLLNYSGGLVDTIRSTLNLPQKDATVWETILDYLKSIEGLNLSALLVEGKETYSFVYNLCSCIATIVLLVVSTLVVVIITPIIRLISHIVILIIHGVKKHKAKKQAADGNASEESAEENANNEEADDAILVLKGVEGADDAVVTVSEEELPEPKKSKKRVWGAVAGVLKGVFLIILLFAPISGIYSIMKTATPETRELISDLVTGNQTQQNVAEQNGPVDMAFDFVDEYKDSAVGKFVESSSYFFGQSLSTLLFDSMASINTSTQNIKLRQELIVYLEAVNALEGNIEVGTWTDEQLAAALDVLKDSKLLPEAMPVAIEYASEIEFLKSALDKAMQTTAFLALRDLDWDKEVETILDTVKEVYKLDLFPLEDFNVLTMNEQVLNQVINTLCEGEFINTLLPILVKTGVKLEAVQNLTGNYDPKNLNLTDISWKEELNGLVDVYTIFKEYGYTDLAQITDANVNDLVESLIVNKTDVTVKLLERLTEMTVFNNILIPVAQSAVDSYLANEQNGFTEFANIINLKDLTIEQWKEDINAIIEVAKLAIDKINVLSLDLKQMDIESKEAIDAMKEIVQSVLTLNLLGDDKTKNDLVLAAIIKFNLLDVDDLYVTSADGTSKVSIFENVNWTTDGDNIGEIDTIKNILEIYKQFVLLDEVNMKDLNIDFITLLDNEDGVDILVSILEELVDSDLTLSLIDPAVNKYLLPITNEFDDDNLVKDIFNNISNKEMAEEIIKIVKAIKDAQTLGLFDVAKNGLGSLKYSETDALINIINTIFDSKILDGVEGRVIRIIFKATKILDIEKGLLDNINFDGEQEMLVNFIHAIENVLQDPNFVLFDEAGNVTLDLEYITQPEIFSQLMSGVEIVLGTLEKDENGNFVETSGSKLVEALLPNIMSTYVIKSIPEEFKGLVEIVDLENLDSALLASDVRRLTYIARQLVEMDLQTIFVNGSIVYTDKLENVYNILDALLGMEMLKPCGNEVFAWIINYVSGKFLAQYNIEEVTAEDFAGVDWAVEAETAKALITQIIEFLEVNNLESTAELIDFINEKGYLTTSFVTTENANRVLEILNTALELNTIEAIAPIAFQVVVNQLVSNNVISKDFWEGSLTGEELVEDLYSVTEIAEILVNDIDFVEMWRASFQGEAIVLPEDTAVNEIIDKLFSLNLVKGYENELVQFALEKYLPKNDVISVESFNVQSITNWDNEVATIKGVVSIVLNILAENEFENVAQITDFINNVKNSSNVVEGLKAYITDNNISLVAGLLDEVVNSQLVANVLPDVVSYGLEQLAKQVIDLQFINDLTAEELQADVHKLVEIINVLVEERIACFIVNKTVEVESKNVYGLLETAKAVVGKINELNLVTKHENELMSTLINKAFALAKLTDFTLSASDLENVDWNDEFTSIQQILTIVQNFAADNHLVVYRDVTKYLDEVKADVKVIVTEVNGRHIVSAVKELANMGTVKALLPQVLSFGIDKAYEAGYDIRFVDEAKLTNDEIANDIVTFANIVIDLIDLGAVKLYKNETIGNLNEAVVKDVANQLANVNILAKFAGEWTAFVVNFALDKLNIKDFNVRYNAENFAGLSDEQWTNDTEKLGNALFAVVSALDELFPAGYSIESIKQFISNKEYSNYDIFTNTLIDCVVDALSNVLAINLIDPIVNDFVSFGVDKLSNVALFKDIDVQFIKEIATREVLSHDVINLGEIAKTMIEFGLFEYLETKTLQKVELDKLNPIFDQIDQMELFQVNRETWMEFIANTVMTAAKLDVRYTAEDFATITDEIATESIQTVKSVVSQLAELLAYWQLESLEEITSFVSGKGYTSATYITDEAVISITEIVDTITTIVPLQSMLPKLAQYGLSKVPEKYDLSFVEPYLEDGTLSGSVLAEDIRTIMAIVVDGVNFGALDLVYKVYEEQPFEVKFEYISSIIEKIDTLHVLEIDYNSWISFASNIGFELAKSVVRVQPEDFAYMTNDAWHEDFATLASIVNSIGEIAKNNNLTFYDDINLFIKEKGYTSAQYVTDENVSDILSVVDTIIGINFIDPYLVKGLSSLIDYVIIGNEALPDMKFVSTAIDNHEYISSDIKDDLRTVIEMVRNVLDFGAIEIYFTQQLSVINVEPIQNIIANINELHLFHLSEAKWFENIFTQVFKALKLDENKYHVSANEYITMNRAEWDQDFESLSHIVGLIGELLDESSITSSSELTEFINNKYYTLAQYVTDENVLVIAEIIETLGGIKALSPALDDLVRYALSEKVNIANVDLSFLVDALENRELTGEMLSSDIQSLASIIKDAVEIGVIDYVYFNKLPELNYDLIKNILVTATGLNTIVVAIDNWAALGFNQLFKALKIENTVSAEDFAMMNATTWSNDVNTIIEIVDRLEALLKANDLNTIEDVQSFFKDKLYTLAQYANNENALALVEIVDLVGTIRVIEPALPVLAKFGVSKVSTDKFDVSFLESHFESDLTGEKLSADIRTVAAMLKEIVEFGTIDYFFYQELDQIQIVKLQNVLTMLNELNIYAVDKESWLVLTVNQLLAALNVEERVTVDSFAGLNPDNEIMHLVDALGEVDALLRALNIVSTNDLKQFIQDKGYINGQYVTDETLDIVLNAVEDIQQMQTLKVLLPVIARWGVDKIASSDLDFLKEAMHNDTFTAEELVEDVKTVISIARNCVALGVFDAIFDIDMETIDGGLVATIVSQIENIHIFNKLRSDWVALGLNKALSALEINVTPEELDVLTNAQWLEDNQKLQNALVSVAELMERLGLTYKSAIVNYVSAPDYKELLGYKELLSEIISNLLNTNTTDVIFDKVLHYVVVKAENAGVDISFLEGSYASSDLVNDVSPILNIVHNLLAFGVKEYIDTKDISSIEVEYIANAVAEIENALVFTKYRNSWVNILIDKAVTALKIDQEIDYSVISLTDEQWKSDNVTLQSLVLKLGEILDNNNLNKYSEVVSFFKDEKKHTLEETYTDTNVALIADAIKLVLSFNSVECLFPQVVCLAINKAYDFNLDLLFLASSLQMEVVKNDVDVLVQMFKPLCKFGLFEIINTKQLQFLNVEYLNPVIDLIPSLGIYNLNRNAWAASLANCLAHALKSDIRVSESDFVGVDWDVENDLFQELVSAVDKFLVETDLVSIDNIKDLQARGFKLQEQYATSENANNLVDVVAAISNLATFNVLSKDLVDFGLAKLETSGLSLTYLTDKVDNNEVTEDVKSIVVALRKLIEFGVVEQMFAKAEINYNAKATLYEAIEKVLNLNVLVNNGNNVVLSIFDKLGIDASRAVGTVVFREEYDSIVTILDSVFTIFENYKITTYEEIAKVVSIIADKGLRIDKSFNENIQALANIIDVLYKDDLFAFVIMPISEKYLSNEKLAGLADLHNIYSNVSELNSDLHNVYVALSNIQSLNIYDCLIGNADYPFDRTFNFTNIINNLFTLNYFNNPGRMDAFVNSLDNLITSVDLSSVNGNNISLADDADDIVEMVKNISAVLTNPDFPIKNKEDIDNKISVSINFFLRQENLDLELAAIKNYMNTTLYGETGAAILIVILPLLKNVLNDYWTALDLDNYSAEMINHDTPYIMAIIETLVNLDYNAIGDGSLAYSALESDVDAIIDNLVELQLLDGHYNDLVALLLRDFVYGKTFGNVTIEQDAFNIENVDFEHDLIVAKDIFRAFIELMASEGNNTMREVSDYFVSFDSKAFLNNDAAMNKVAEIVEYVAQLTIIEQNALALYNTFAVPSLGDNVKYVDYRSATNEELYADLVKVPEVIRLAVAMNVFGIIDGETIDYVGADGLMADRVEQLLNILASTNYIELHFAKIINRLSNKFEGLRTYGASYETIDVTGDANKVAQAYRVLVPYLSSSEFPVKTINDFGKLLTKQTIIDAQGYGEYLVNAYEILAQTSVAPYVVPTVVNKAKEFVGGRLQSIVNVLTTDGLTLEQLTNDVLLSITLVKDVYESRIYRFVLDKDLTFPTSEVAVEIVDTALSMNIISTKFNELVKAVFVEFNIDTADIDFAAFDCETEKQIIKAVVSETFDILAECELTTLSAVKAEIKDLINTVKVSRRSFARKVVDLLSNVQKERFVRIIETIAESQLFVETFIPVYNKVLSKYGSLFGTYEEYLSLEGYTKAALDSDVEIFAQAVRALFESKLHQVYTAKAQLSDSQMAAAQTSVRLFGQLQILELKKQAAVDILEKLVKVDLSDIDVNTIDVEFDFNLLAEALPMLCTVIRDSNLRFSVRLFGNTEFMNAAIDVLELFFESTTSKEFMPVIVRKATNKLSSMINVTFSEKTDEQVYSLCDDIIVALRALSEMGAFSNNGVDFTNSELTDKVFAVIYNNVNLRSYKKYFDKFVRNIAEYGVISLNYEAASTSNEISVAKGLIKQLITFVKTYVTYIKNKDLSIVSDPVFQADVTSLVNKALESDLLAQVFMPVIVGTTKVATENYGKFAMFTGMTNSQFVNVALPDLFQIVSYVETLGLFRRTINYKDVDTIVALADLVVTSPVTKDLLNDLIPAAFKFAMKINLDRDELAAANVDYVNEVSIITTFLRGIESELQNISISDPSTMMTQEFLLAVANNGAVLENSKLAQLYMKRVMRKVINKVSSTTDALDFMLTALNDPSYTNEQAMDDYLLILKVMKEAAYINFFGADLDFAALDGHIDVLLDNLFALHAVDGNEEAVMSMILSKLSFVDTSSIDLSVVSDWDQEFASFTEMCAALATLCADPNFDIENMTTSMFENSAIQTKFVAFVDKASESYVGSEMFKELFKTKVDNNLPADAQGIIDIDTLPRDKWAEEFEELFEIYVVISQGISNMTFNDVLSAYDVMFGLNGKDGIEAVKADYKYWLTKLIDQSNFTVPNSNVRIKTELIPDDNALAYNEVVAVREVIVNMASYLDPATDKICDFDYEVIETSKDYVKLADTLIAVSKALSMREVILGVVSEAVNNNSDESGKSTFVLAEMISDAFKRQYATSRVDYTGYDEMFWTEEELTKMAIIVACANALELDSEGATDIYTMDLGTTYPDITVYENVVSTGSGLFPSQVAGANQVGLRQMLQLFVVSNVFDISCFGGEDGVIATKLESGTNPILSSKFNRPLGTLSSEDEFNETIALTNALADLRDLGLIDGTDIASSLYLFETVKTEKLLRNMNESVILRPMLAVIVYEATKETMVNHGGLNEVQAATYIETYLPDLANQYNASNPLASKEDYNAIISSYINTIKGFKGEI